MCNSSHSKTVERFCGHPSILVITMHWENSYKFAISTTAPLEMGPTLIKTSGSIADGIARSCAWGICTLQDKARMYGSDTRMKLTTFSARNRTQTKALLQKGLLEVESCVVVPVVDWGCSHVGKWGARRVELTLPSAINFTSSDDRAIYGLFVHSVQQITLCSCLTCNNAN